MPYRAAVQVAMLCAVPTYAGCWMQIEEEDSAQDAAADMEE